MMGIPTEEWYDLQYPGLMFYQTSSQEVLHTEPTTDEIKEVILRNKRNIKLMRVVDTILDSASEAIFDEN